MLSVIGVRCTATSLQTALKSAVVRGDGFEGVDHLPGSWLRKWTECGARAAARGGGDEGGLLAAGQRRVAWGRDGGRGRGGDWAGLQKRTHRTRGRLLLRSSRFQGWGRNVPYANLQH